MTDANQETTDGGGGGGRNDSWGWLSSAVSPPRVRATEGDQDGQPNQGSPLGPETLQGRPKGGSAEIKKKSQLNKHCMQTEKTLLGLLFPAQHLGQVQEQTVGDT